MLNYFTHSGAAPLPHTNIGDISDNYERISPTFLVIILLTRRRELGENLLTDRRQTVS